MNWNVKKDIGNVSVYVCCVDVATWLRMMSLLSTQKSATASSRIRVGKKMSPKRKIDTKRTAGEYELKKGNTKEGWREEEREAREFSE